MNISDITTKENIYGILDALERESDEGVSNEQEILAEVFQNLEKNIFNEIIKNDILDVINLSNLNYFAKGLKVGARINDLLMNAPCNGYKGLGI